MVIVANSTTNYLSFKKQFGEFLKSKKTLFTADRGMYLSNSFLEVDKTIFGTSFFGISGKCYGIGYMEQNFINSDVTLQKLSQVVDKGLVFKYTEPYSFSNFFSILREFEAGLAAEAKVIAENDALKARFKERKEAYKIFKAEKKAEYEESLVQWKVSAKEVDKQNKQNLKEWEEAYNKADESLRKFITKPEEIPEPKKPEEPYYGEKPSEPPLIALPKVKNIRDERIDTTTAYRILRKFRYCRVVGTEWGIMIKRDKELTLTMANIPLLKVEDISIDEFKEFLSENDNDLKNAENVKQSFYNHDIPELLATIDDSLFDLKFKEEELEGYSLPPLAGIKPMFAASMLAGGIGEYFQEVELDGEAIAIKGAMVKTTSERKTLLNGKEITEVIESNIQKLGVYNTETFNFQLLG